MNPTVGLVFSTTRLDGSANDLFGDLKDDAAVGDTTILLSLTGKAGFGKSDLAGTPDFKKDEAFLLFPLEEAKSEDLGR